MKKVLLYLILIVAIISCKTEEEKIIDAINDNNIDKVIKILSKIDNIGIKNDLLIKSYKLNNIQLFKLLLENGADPNTEYDRSNLLKLAYSENNHEYVKLLIQFGSDINIIIKENKKYINFVYSVINNNYGNLLELCIEKYNINYIDNNGNTILHVASENDISKKNLERIIKKVNNINIENKRNETPFLLSCRNNKIINMKLLYENGANININSKYNYPWGIAISKIYKNNDYKVANYLIKYGSNINNIRSHVGKTPLAHACEIKNIEIAEFLLKNGADPYNKDEYGKNALNYLGGPFEYTEEEYSKFKNLFDKYK